MEPLNFARVWPETVAAVRPHTDLLWPVAAAFLFLPQLILARQIGDRTPDQLFAVGSLGGDIAVMTLLILSSLIGQITIARIIQADGTGGETLGGVLKAAALLLVPGLAVSMIQGIGIGFGLLLFVIPGLWLMARLAPAIPLLAAGQSDPLEVIREAWALTRGRAFSIFGMLAILLLGFLLLAIGIGGLGAAVGVVSTIAAGGPAEGWGIGRWLFELVNAAASAAMGTFYIAFLATLTATLKRLPARD